MAKLGDIVAAVKILNPGKVVEEIYLAGAEHDEIYLPFDEDQEVTDEMYTTLTDHGAVWCEETDRWMMFV